MGQISQIVLVSVMGPLFSTPAVSAWGETPPYRPMKARTVQVRAQQSLGTKHTRLCLAVPRGQFYWPRFWPRLFVLLTE